MKITHLLEAPSKLQAFITKNSTHFQQFGDNYVFIWTDEVLAALRRAGIKSNEDIDTVVVPYEIGLGIVNAVTGDVCVGAIDPDYDALWASSADVSDFFVATKNRKLIRLPNRLQNLADMLKRAAEPEREAGGIDAVVDYIDEYGIESLDVDKIKAMDTVEEVRDYLENLRDDVQAELDKTKEERGEIVAKAKALLKSGNKKAAQNHLNHLDELNKDIDISAKIDAEDILKQKHLFVEPGEDSDTSDVDSEIDSWTRNFNRDFPDLDLPDAREFSPT